MSRFIVLFSICRGSMLATIDFAQSDEVCAQILFNAAATSGFFYIVNHGIALHEQEDIFKSSRELFDLNITTKVNLSLDSTHWGYILSGYETTDPSKQSVGDTKEGFYLYNERTKRRIAKQNRWPTSFLSPHWKRVITNYMNNMHSISIRLSRIIALSLNLSAQFFEAPGIRDDAVDLLYLLHYPQQKSDIERGVYGTGEHTDYDLFTILLTDSNPGLQILFEHDWIDVEHKAGSFVVNIADTLQKRTNDMYKSVLHRVVITENYDRYSVPYFVAANQDLIVDCLPTTVIPNHPTYSKCNHQPFVAGEYLQYKLSSTFAGYFDDESSDIHQEL